MGAADLVADSQVGAPHELRGRLWSAAGRADADHRHAPRAPEQRHGVLCPVSALFRIVCVRRGALPRTGVAQQWLQGQTRCSPRRLSSARRHTPAIPDYLPLGPCRRHQGPQAGTVTAYLARRETCRGVTNGERVWQVVRDHGALQRLPRRELGQRRSAAHARALGAHLQRAGARERGRERRNRAARRARQSLDPVELGDDLQRDCAGARGR